MKLLKYMTAIPMACLFIGSAYASSNREIYYYVPFTDVKVPAASKIYVNYEFDPHKQVLVCSENGNSAITSVEWVYKDVMYRSMLPVTLNDHLGFQGQIADPDGTLMITNEYGGGPSDDGAIYVSCEYVSAR